MRSDIVNNPDLPTFIDSQPEIIVDLAAAIVSKSPSEVVVAVEAYGHALLHPELIDREGMRKIRMELYEVDHRLPNRYLKTMRKLKFWQARLVEDAVARTVYFIKDESRRRANEG